MFDYSIRSNLLRREANFSGVYAKSWQQDVTHSLGHTKKTA